MTPEEHTNLLRAFEVDRLLKLLALEAKKHFNGHYAIFSFTTGSKVAFGTPDMTAGTGRDQLSRIPLCPTLKDAVIAALVTAQAFADAREDAAAHPSTDALVWGGLTFEHRGRPCCRGEVAWAHGGTSPLVFVCECGKQFIFTIERSGDPLGKDGPICQAIMHIHTAHHLPVDAVYRIFQAFPQFGVALAKQQAALAGSHAGESGDAAHA